MDRQGLFMNRYRVKKNVIKETITGREIETYYTIEKCRKKYFIFGPLIWVTYCERQLMENVFEENVYVSLPVKFRKLEEASVVCRRLNDNLPKTYNDSVIMEIKL